MKAVGFSAPMPGDRAALHHDGHTDVVTVVKIKAGDRVLVQFPSGNMLIAPWSMLDHGSHTRHRSNDRDTARHAAERVNLSDGQRKVLLALAGAGSHGLIDHDHEALIGLIPTSAGKRRLELVEHGLVEDSGKRRDTPTGSPAIVWVLTAAGRDMARRGAA